MKNILLIILFCIGGQCWADLSHPQCNNTLEARAAFAELIPKFSNATDEELIHSYEVLGSECFELLRQDPLIQIQLEERIAIRQTEMLRADNRRFDLNRLSSLHQLVGTEISNETREHISRLEQQARSNCGTVDRRAEMPPVRDQDSIGWCYAFSAADLVSHRTGQTVSAIDLAMNYNMHQNASNLFRGLFDTARSLEIDWQNRSASFDSEILNGYLALNEDVTEREGGWSENALNILSSRGYCLESTLPSDSYETAELGSFLHAISEIDRGRSTSKHAPENPSAEYLAGEFCQRYGHFLTELNIDMTLSEVVTAVGAQSVSEQFFIKSMEACQENRVPFAGHAVQVRSWQAGDGGLTGIIDQQLDSGNIIGLNYNVDLIGATAGEFSLHASSIVGRRWSDESHSCQYLIRNSWGESCVFYGEMMDRCENGHIWVDAGNLEDRSTGVTYFE